MRLLYYIKKIVFKLTKRYKSVITFILKSKAIIIISKITFKYLYSFIHTKKESFLYLSSNEYKIILFVFLIFNCYNLIKNFIKIS